VDLPPAKDVEAKYPQFRVALDQLRNAPSTRASQGAVMGAFPQVRDAVKRAIEDMLLNNRDPDEAVDRAARDATKEIENYNKRVGQ
jgi:sn-glycerol 3-phosphate transport system substrate-binding protein